MFVLTLSTGIWAVSQTTHGNSIPETAGHSFLPGRGTEAIRKRCKVVEMTRYSPFFVINCCFSKSYPRAPMA